MKILRVIIIVRVCIWALALPLIPLPGPSPRKNGEKCAGRKDGSNSATSKIGGSIDEVALLPVLTGRRCRQADEGRRQEFRQARQPPLASPLHQFQPFRRRTRQFRPVEFLLERVEDVVVDAPAAAQFVELVSLRL